MRLPITRSKLVLASSHTITPAYHILLFQTMFLMAFYGFFRVGELTIKTPEPWHSVLQFQSLSFLKSQSEVQAAKLVISDYKHNTTGRPFSIIIQRLDCTILSCEIFTTLVPGDRIQFCSTFLPSRQNGGLYAAAQRSPCLL